VKCLITEDGYYEKISSRAEMANYIFLDKKKFTNKLNLKLKKQISKCLVR